MIVTESFAQTINMNVKQEQKKKVCGLFLFVGRIQKENIVSCEGKLSKQSR